MKKHTLTLFALAAGLLASPAFAEHDDASAGSGKPHFSKADTNQDGFISKDEWVVRAEEGFNKSDADKDGKLSKDERKASYEKMKARRAEWKAKHQGEHPEGGPQAGHHEGAPHEGNKAAD